MRTVKKPTNKVLMKASESNSKYLIIAFKKGDPDAITHIYKKYYRKFVFFAFSLVRNMEESEDIVVETFIKLLEKKIEVDTLPDLENFLIRAIRNACYNFLLRERKKIGWHKEILYQIKNDDDFISSKIFETEVIKRIMDQVENLPPVRKQIFKMIFVEGLDTIEIANRMNITVDTVRVQKARALHSLREIFSKTGLFSILVLWHGLIFTGLCIFLK